MGLFDRIINAVSPSLTPEQIQATNEAKVGYGFGDYWWLRDSFIRMMLDIKGPISAPWYNRSTVRQFIDLWGHSGVVDALRVRLTQVDREFDYSEIAELHQTAKNVEKLCYGVSDPADIEIIAAFVEKAAIRLYAVDHWFARDYWPEDFKPLDNRGEFESMSIQTAMMHAPFSR